MTRSDLGKRMAVFMVMIVAGYFLGTYLDRCFTAPDAEPGVTWNDDTRADHAASGCHSGVRERLLNIRSPASSSDDG
jgi:hypothetical protein